MNQKIEYVLIFTKLGLLRYISHLDLVRLFQRVVRRAGLPVEFSKGFHPIPKIKFERALKLGIESKSEKAYIKLKKSLSTGKIKDKLNKELPKDIQVLEIVKLDISSNS